MVEKTVSIIIPTYNERPNICQLLRAILSVLGDGEWEILVVDDDSPDLTWQEVELMSGEDDRVRLLRRSGKRGLASAIRDGIASTSGKVVIWLDADQSMSPLLIPVLIAQVAAGADIAYGSRYIPGGGMKGSDASGQGTLFRIWRNLRTSEDSWLSAMISLVGNRVIAALLATGLHDYSSGYFACRRAVVEQLPVEGGIVDYCIVLLYRAVMKGFTVIEVPMVLAPRRYGKSKTSNTLPAIITIAAACLGRALQLKFSVSDERRKSL